MNEKAVHGLLSEMLQLIDDHQDLLRTAGMMLQRDTEEMRSMLASLEETREKKTTLEQQVEALQRQNDRLLQLNETLNNENNSWMRQNGELLSLQRG